MRKAEIEAEVSRLRVQNQLYIDALQAVRQVARDCIGKGSQINHVWLVEKITETLTKGTERWININT